METKGYTISLTARDGKKTHGHIDVIHWSKEEKFKRALKFGLGCWGISICCIVLPIVHFLLVPLFFLAGPFVARFIYKQENYIQGGEGPCPYCNSPVKIGKGPATWPPSALEELCTQCQNNCTITL